MELVCASVQYGEIADTHQFWHLSPDHMLSAEPKLKAQAEERFGEQRDYGEMHTGDQVRRYVSLACF